MDGLSRCCKHRLENYKHKLDRLLSELEDGDGRESQRIHIRDVLDHETMFPCLLVIMGSSTGFLQASKYPWKDSLAAEVHNYHRHITISMIIMYDCTCSECRCLELYDCMLSWPPPPPVAATTEWRHKTTQHCNFSRTCIYICKETVSRYDLPSIRP